MAQRARSISHDPLALLLLLLLWYSSSSSSSSSSSILRIGPTENNEPNKNSRLTHRWRALYEINIIYYFSFHPAMCSMIFYIDHS